MVREGSYEMNRRKGYIYMTVFANLMAKRVFFATPRKNSLFWVPVVAELPRHKSHPKDNQHVAIDIRAFRTRGARDTLGNARLVSDKLNVTRNVVEACDQVRKAESRADDGKPVRLEQTGPLWLNNRGNWTEKDVKKWESMVTGRCVPGRSTR